MGKKHYTPEQIIGKLREAEVALAQGETAAQVCRNPDTTNRIKAVMFKRDHRAILKLPGVG